MNESFIGTDTDLKGSRSAGATLIAKLPPSQIIFEEFRPRQFRFLIKQLTGQHHTVISQSHSRTCPSVPSLPSCLVVFQLFQLVKLTEFALNGHSVAAGESALTSDGLSDSHLCYDVRRSRTSVVLLILFLLLCVNCKPILPPRSSVTAINTASSVLIAGNAFTASANED